jgi:hypothetical protein
MASPGHAPGQKLGLLLHILQLHMGKAAHCCSGVGATATILLTACHACCCCETLADCAAVLYTTASSGCHCKSRLICHCTWPTLSAAAPEWAEATGLVQDSAASSTNGNGSSSSSVQDPARSIPTLSWQQLQQLLQEQQPQQLVVLQVATGDDEAPAR